MSAFAALYRSQIRSFSVRLPAMKIASFLFFTVLAACGGPLLHAQETVAHGDYRITALRHQPRNNHWVLTALPNAGYLLRSESESSTDGIRVVQVEELDKQFVPTSIAHELYLKGHTQPDAVVKCSFAAGAITCEGKSEKGTASPSRPYPYKGAVLLSVRDLSRFDFGWLIAGTLNMAHAAGNASIHTIHVAGGAALELTDDINVAALQAVPGLKQKLKIIRPEGYTDWEFISGKDEELTFVGTENIELGGTIAPTGHYSLTSGDQTLHFWLAQPGLLVKMSRGADVEYTLTNYRQFRKLIAEVRVDVSTPQGDPGK